MELVAEETTLTAAVVPKDEVFDCVGLSQFEGYSG